MRKCDYKTELQQDWEPVTVILKDLGVCGQSDDESEIEDRQKRVRRRKLEWRAEELTTLLHTIDRAYIPESFAGATGNRPYERHQEHRNIDSCKERVPVPGLPSNYYDNKWLSSLRLAEKQRLQIKQAKQLPSMVGSIIMPRSSIPIEFYD